MRQSTKAVAALALLAVLLGASFLPAIQQNFVPVQGFKPVGTDSLKVFFEALLRLPKSIVSFFMMDASAADRYLVLTDPGCSQFNIATDIDCWSATDGGAGGVSVPTVGDRVVLTLASDPTGTTAAFFDASMTVDAWCARNACSGFGTFVGTITLDPFHLTVGVAGGTCDPVLCSFDTAGTFIMSGSGSILTITDGDFLNTAGTFTAFNDGGGGQVEMTATSPGSYLMSLQGPSTTFDRLTFSGPAEQSDDFTIQLGDITANFVVISQTVLNVDARKVILTVQAFPADGFVRLHMGSLTAGYIMSGLAILSPFAFDYSPSLGGPNTLSIDSWQSNSQTNMTWTQTMSEDVPNPYSVAFAFFTPGRMYRLLRDYIVIDTAQDIEGLVTFSETNSGWSGTHVMTIVPVSAAGPPATPQTISTIVQCSSARFMDIREQAANAILYRWDFGDGTMATTTNGNITHTYAADGRYLVTVAIQDRSGAINNYAISVTITGTATSQICSVGAFLANYWVEALALLVLVALGLLIILRKKLSDNWKRILMWTAIGGGIILLVYFLFFY